MKNYFRFLREYLLLERKIFTLALTFSILANLAILINPLLIQKVIDDIIIGDKISQLLPYLIGATIFNLLCAFFEDRRHYFVRIINTNLPLKLNQQFIRKLETLDLSYFRSGKSGDLINRSQKDIFSLSSTSMIFTFNGINQIVRVILLLITSLFITPKLVVVALLTLPIYLFIRRYYERLIVENEHRFRDIDSDLTSYEKEILSSVKTIKHLSGEDKILQKLSNRIDEHAKQNFKTERISLTHTILSNLITYTIPILILSFGGYLLTLGEVSMGEVLSSFYLAVMIFPSMNALLRTSKFIKRNDIIAKRVYEILDIEPKIIESLICKKIDDIKGDIEFKDIIFSYEDGNRVLNELNLKIEQKQSLAIVGRSGEGKSTILNLIMRFFDPDSGEIYLDDHNLKDLSFQTIRDNIAVVSQNIYLFNTTIKENFTLLIPEIGMDEIKSACRIANIHTLIESLPDGYETQIGELGGKFSGGERQRLSIARAIVQKPKIILFDEATASLDSRNERVIIDLIENNLSSCTRIYVAHRLSSITHCDNIICLESGRVIESGTHSELLNSGNFYRKLWEKQSCGSEK